jgi:hypothetical protein
MMDWYRMAGFGTAKLPTPSVVPIDEHDRSIGFREPLESVALALTGHQFGHPAAGNGQARVPVRRRSVGSGMASSA